ncbi:unnamed protein product [Ectocarpus sp. 8 AP-2014]
MGGHRWGEPFRLASPPSRETRAWGSAESVPAAGGPRCSRQDFPGASEYHLNSTSIVPPLNHVGQHPHHHSNSSSSSSSSSSHMGDTAESTRSHTEDCTGYPATFTTEYHFRSRFFPPRCFRLVQFFFFFFSPTRKDGSLSPMCTHAHATPAPTFHTLNALRLVYPRQKNSKQVTRLSSCEYLGAVVCTRRSVIPALVPLAFSSYHAAPHLRPLRSPLSLSLI